MIGPSVTAHEQTLKGFSDCLFWLFQNAEPGKSRSSLKVIGSNERTDRQTDGKIYTRSRYGSSKQRRLTEFRDSSIPTISLTLLILFFCQKAGIIKKEKKEKVCDSIRWRFLFYFEACMKSGWKNITCRFQVLSFELFSTIPL
jgi:hypothetical protein